MEKETFELLVSISKLEFFDFKRPNVTDIHISKFRDDIDRKLKILLSRGFISYNDNETYSITQLGYNISLHNSWSDFLEFQKNVIDRKFKKDKNDLIISEFQVKTKNYPFIISIFGIAISITAFVLSIIEYNEGKSSNKQEKQQQEKVLSVKQNKVFHTKKADSTNSK